MRGGEACLGGALITAQCTWHNVCPPVILIYRSTVMALALLHSGRATLPGEAGSRHEPHQPHHALL
jgi:hypothetical protein